MPYKRLLDTKFFSVHVVVHKCVNQALFSPPMCVCEYTLHSVHMTLENVRVYLNFTCLLFSFGIREPINLTNIPDLCNTCTIFIDPVRGGLKIGVCLLSEFTVSTFPFRSALPFIAIFLVKNTYLSRSKFICNMQLFTVPTKYYVVDEINRLCKT